jgi:hypothetical protein
MHASKHASGLRLRQQKLSEAALKNVLGLGWGRAVDQVTAKGTTGTLLMPGQSCSDRTHCQKSRKVEWYLISGHAVVQLKETY